MNASNSVHDTVHGQRRFFSPLLLCLLLAAQIALLWPASPTHGVERRRDQFGRDFGYFIYPIASEIPGLGTAAGAGATVLNMFDTDADFTGFNIKGDFDASGYTLLDLHLIEETLVLDVGTFGFHVAPVVYGRGIDAPLDQFIQPDVEGAYNLAQLTYTLDQRAYEVYYRLLQGKTHLNEVLDKDGNIMPAVDTAEKKVKVYSYGGSIDFTDDRLDPWSGVRLEVSRQFPETTDPLASTGYVTDTNLTGYVPFRKWDTLALNFFRSDATVTRQGETDPATLKTLVGFKCGVLTEPAQSQCLAEETAYITDLIAQQTNGNATSLGGTQRLRAFPGGRFHAGHTLFYGLEYRWNLNDERTPFDIWMARGVRTGFQLAFFYERGTVNDDASKLWENMRTSYGVGARMRLSGVIIRADFARGEEGNNFLLFINYPWSMFSVDNPG